MGKIIEYTSGFISKAVNEVKKIKPDYRLLLELYEKIFIAQEESKKSIHLKEYGIPDEVLSVRLKEKLPLVDISQFIIDEDSAGSLFRNICEILLAENRGISDSVKRIIDAIDNKSLAVPDLFSAYMKEDESFFMTIADGFNLDRNVLGFVIYNSIKPSLALFSQMISDYLDKEKEWDRGYCPICGSMPEISVFEDNGRRSLLCSFCGHKWQSKRVYCSFCENIDHESLHYFEIENEEEYRVDVCDRCKRYIKTVDIKKTSRSVYLPLESVSTPYIDLKFKEMGYMSGTETID